MSSTCPVIDIGVNVLNRQFQKDLPRVLKRSAEENVHTIIATGTDMKVSERSIALIRKRRNIPLPRLFCTVGIHPHSAKDAVPDFAKRQTDLIETNRDVVVAVGECGLDFNRDFSPRTVQIEVFRQQVQVACDLHLPLFCHEREAHTEFLDVLVPFLETGKLQASQVVVHCFTGNAAELKRYVGLGFSIGLTGFVCMSRRGFELRQVISMIPLSQLMVETDAPFMHPSQAKQRCEPHHIHAVVQTIAECMGCPATDVAAATTANATRFFKLDEAVFRRAHSAPRLSTAQSYPPAPPQIRLAPSNGSYISVDGSTLEGGGQILRLAFPLAALLGKDIQVHSIRAGRPRPGLANQHLCGLNLIDSLSWLWNLSGHELQSTRVSLAHSEAGGAIVFKGSKFHAAMDTAGAVTLVLQGVLPLFVLSDQPNPIELTLVGGTHGKFAPTADWFELAFAPLLQRMGVYFDMRVNRCGFVPRGGGHVTVICPGGASLPLRPLLLDTPSRLVQHLVCRIICATDTDGRATCAALRKQFRFAFGVGTNVDWTEEVVVDGGLQTKNGSSGPYVHVTLFLGNGNILTAGGHPSKSVDAAVADIVAELDRVWDGDACVDEHLADNILVYMAMAQGTSRLRIPLETTSQHVEAAIYVISLIARARFHVETCSKSRLVTCHGIGFQPMTE
ncbi:RNA 3'-phosphate cyclase [Aphanomyces invadans]|uniref:RNA 3'-phosphate cyclase n=2 Tax=Aphanomyces invadans TaxID=157072 RepID=A0A024USJ9_9STRA|nr:RNA 3'-phosphate cyclase [Aphanomyces invadans]ETW08900.1 RNA 3'-phosphate cyclase [Aphanomyces invadans]|eukprot:XP_008862705.1 RNA 3'-phosphate cyclase [Aphanomyces invadans]